MNPGMKKVGAVLICARTRIDWDARVRSWTWRLSRYFRENDG
jgi:hypothetical protein